MIMERNKYKTVILDLGGNLLGYSFNNLTATFPNFFTARKLCH
jgi:hypothetical protein